MFSMIISPQFRVFTTSLDSTIIPKNIYAALECPEWKNAFREEMKTLEKNRTWEICALPKGLKIVGCKWVFSLKYKADGNLDRHKARLVAKGFTQTVFIGLFLCSCKIIHLKRVLLNKGKRKRCFIIEEEQIVGECPRIKNYSFPLLTLFLFLRRKWLELFCYP